MKEKHNKPKSMGHMKKLERSRTSNLIAYLKALEQQEK